MQNEAKLKLMGMSERLIVRRLCADDQDEYLDVLRRSAESHGPWSPLPVAGRDPFGPEAFQSQLDMDDGEHCLRSLITRKSDGAILGNINANGIVRGVFQSSFIGYWLAAGETGRGYMGEGLGLFIDFCFRDRGEGGLGLHRVEANVMPRNAASLAVVKGLGFLQEGLSPRYLKIAGVWEDHARFALLCDEWAGFLNRKKGRAGLKSSS